MKTTTLILLLTPSLAFGWRICLDPGHGGVDPGAGAVCGADSVYEKNVNLQVGRLARDFLSALSDSIEIGMTRDEDTTRSIEWRADFANNVFMADRFISIHHNASVTHDAQGTETWWHTLNGDTVNSKLLAADVVKFLHWAFNYPLRGDNGVQRDTDPHGRRRILYLLQMAGTLGEASFLDYDGAQYGDEACKFHTDWKHGRDEAWHYAAGITKHIEILPRFTLYIGGERVPGIGEIYVDLEQEICTLGVFLSNPTDEVNGFQVTIKYETSCGEITDLFTLDSIYVYGSYGEGWEGKYYAPWYWYADQNEYEWFSFNLNYPGGGSGWKLVSAVGTMEFTGLPPINPPIRPRDQQLLYAFEFQKDPDFQTGDSIFFYFETIECTENILTDPTGSTVWGPDEESAPSPYPCPQRDDSLRVVKCQEVQLRVWASTSIAEPTLMDKHLSSLSSPFRAFPNPFRGKIVIGYFLPRRSNTELKIFDVTGRLVKTLVKGFKEAGHHTISWNTADEIGQQAPNGVYVCRLDACSRTHTRKIILLK